MNYLALLIFCLEKGKRALENSGKTRVREKNDPNYSRMSHSIIHEPNGPKKTKPLCILIYGLVYVFN